MEPTKIYECMFSAFGEAKWRLFSSWLNVGETKAKRWFFGEEPLPDHLQAALQTSAREVDELIEGLDALVGTARANGVDDIMIAHRLGLFVKRLPRHARPQPVRS